MKKNLIEKEYSAKLINKEEKNEEKNHEGEIKEKDDKELEKPEVNIEEGYQEKEDQSNMEFRDGNHYQIEIFKSPAEKLALYGNEINKLKILNEENMDIKSNKENDTTILLNSFLNKIFDISEMKKDYENESINLKKNFYKYDKCASFLDCFCCRCCNYEFFTCFKKCCSKCTCSVINTKINYDDYKNEMNDFKDDEEKLIKCLEDLRTDYIFKKDNINTENINYSKLKLICYYIFFSLVSLAHFFLMAVIEAIIFSLTREIVRTIYFFIYEKYDEKDRKDFDYYLKKSSKNDTSQINFNYLSSFITELFICKTNIVIPYIVSNISIIIIVALMLLFDFLKKEDIDNNINNYSELDCIILSIFLILIYCFSGIISLYPVYIIKQSQYYRKISISLICLLLTLSVCLKNLIQGIYELPLIWHLYLIIIISSVVSFILILYYIVNYGCSCCTCFSCFTSLFKCGDKKEKGENGPDTKQEKEETKKSKHTSIKKNPDYSANYILGYLIIGNDFMKISIKIKGFCSYLGSIFGNLKIIFILLINFCGRAQKLKSKIDYKLYFNEKFYCTICNFLISFGIYLILIIFINSYIHCKGNIKNEKQITEFIIIIGLVIENIVILILSFLKIYETDDKSISFWAIAISGCFNFILYEYYSTIEIEYITASGFISLAQLPFRLLEQLKLKGEVWSWIQIGFGFAGFVFNISYLFYLKYKENSKKIINDISKIKVILND